MKREYNKGRTQTFRARITQEERDKLLNTAELRGVSVSELVREFITKL